MRVGIAECIAGLDVGLGVVEGDDIIDYNVGMHVGLYAFVVAWHSRNAMTLGSRLLMLTESIKCDAISQDLTLGLVTRVL